MNTINELTNWFASFDLWQLCIVAEQAALWAATERKACDCEWRIEIPNSGIALHKQEGVVSVALPPPTSHLVHHIPSFLIAKRLCRKQ